MDAKGRVVPGGGVSWLAMKPKITAAPITVPTMVTPASRRRGGRASGMRRMSAPPEESCRPASAGDRAGRSRCVSISDVLERDAPATHELGPVPRRPSDTRALLVVTLLVAMAITAWAIHGHAMWFDELQAWNIARASHSLPELFTNL